MNVKPLVMMPRMTVPTTVPAMRPIPPQDRVGLMLTSAVFGLSVLVLPAHPLVTRTEPATRPTPVLMSAAVPQLLPLSAQDLEQGDAGYDWDYIYEPDAPTVIDELLVRYVESQVYQAVAENMASEQSARMVAMKAATDNAGNLINELKLIYNKTRQAGITKELSEIVAGAAAV